MEVSIVEKPFCITNYWQEFSDTTVETAQDAKHIDMAAFKESIPPFEVRTSNFQIIL